MIIHAKRRGFWGVRWFVVCAIGQRMAKRVAIFFLVLLPLLVFGDYKAHILYFPTLSSSNTTYHTANSLADETAIYQAYFYHVLGFVRQSSSLASPSTSSSTSWGSLLNNQIAIGAGNYYTNSPAIFPRVYDLYVVANSLVSSGYSGPGITYVFSSGTRTCYNVYFPDLMSDVFSSTNTVFRQILLQHLSNINSSLSSIGSSVGTINTDYQTVNNLYLDPSKQNLLDSAANPSSLNSNSSIAANLDRLFGSSYAGRESEITKALSDLARSQLQAAWLSTLDPDSPFYMQNLDNIISDPSTFQQAALQGGGGGGSALANIMRDVKKLSTNDWVSGVTNQLSNNRASITNQLAHMFDDDTSVGFKLGNIQTSSALTASAAGSIDQRLANGITVAVVNSGANSVLVSLDGPINIDQTQFNSLSVPLGSLQNTVSDWYSDWYDFFRNGTQYRWGQFVDYFLEYKTQNHLDLLALSSLSNSLSSIQDLLRTSLPDLTNNVSSDFSALLLDDYDDYITNGHYSDFLFDLQSQYPDVFADLDQLGLSSQTGSGNWWTLAGTTLGYLSACCRSNTVMLSSVVSDMQEVHDFAEASLDLGIFGTARHAASKVPSVTDVESKLDQLTNIVNQISFDRVFDTVNSFSNSLESALSPFNRDTPLPSSLVFVVLKQSPNSPGKTFTIPVAERRSVWDLIRLSMGVALFVVNLILLPKFILRVVRLYVRLFWGALSLPK